MSIPNIQCQIRMFGMTVTKRLEPLQDYLSNMDSQHKSSSKSIQDKVKVSANFTYVCLFLFFWTMTISVVSWLNRTTNMPQTSIQSFIKYSLRTNNERKYISLQHSEFSLLSILQLLFIVNRSVQPLNNYQPLKNNNRMNVENGLH